jgi:hypothetical protein
LGDVSFEKNLQVKKKNRENNEKYTVVNYDRTK